MELSRALGPLPEQTENRRVFLEVVRWCDAKRLRLHGFGAPDPGGFDALFDYEFGGRFKRAVFWSRPTGGGPRSRVFRASRSETLRAPGHG